MTAKDTTTDAQATPARPRARWRPWRWLLGSFAGLSLLLLLLLGWGFGTQSGLRTLVDLAERARPGMLSVGSVNGSLLQPLSLRDLHLVLPELEVDVGEIDLDWRPGRLLSGTVQIDRLQVTDTKILIAETEKPKSKEPLQLPDLNLPVAIELGQARVERLSLAPRDAPSEPSLVLTRADLAASLARSQLELRELEVELAVPQVTAAAAGRLELHADYPVDLTLNWTFAQAPALQLAGQGSVRGDLMRLEIDHQVSGSAEVRLKGELHQVLEQPSWNAEIHLSALDVPQIVADAPEIDAEARLRSSGDLQSAKVTGDLTAEAPAHPEMGRVTADLDVNWQDQVLRIDALNLSELGSGGILDVEGRIDLSSPPGEVDLAGVWQQLRWPLTGEARFSSPDGTFDLKGSLDAYDYKLAAQVFGQEIPETAIALRGEGDQRSARIAELRLDSLGGQTIAKGSLTWQPSLLWDLAVTAQDIDPGLQWSGLDGRLGLKAESKGGLNDGFDYQAKADVALKAYPAMVMNLVGQGSATALTIADLTAETLGGRISGSGGLSLAPELAWDAQLQVTDIDPGKHAPEWPGRLSGAIESTGRMTARGPDLDARISDFGGQLRGYPVALDAVLELTDGALELDELEARSGSSSLTAKGRARLPGQDGEEPGVAVDFGFHSPNLGELLPQASGRLDLDGQVSGTLEAPRIRLELAGKDIVVEQQGIATLAGKADLGLGPENPLQAQLTAETLSLGGMRFERLGLNLDGRLTAHQLTASLAGEELAADLAISGGQPADGGYAGDLTQFRIASQDFGTWTLKGSAPLGLGQGRIALGPLCIGESQGSGSCVQFSQNQPGVFDAKLNVQRIAFALFDPLLPPNVDLAGYSRIEADFAARDAVVTGSAKVLIPEGEIELAVPGAGEPVVFSDSQLVLTAQANGVEAGLDVPLAGIGALQAQARLPGFAVLAPALDTQRLDGRLQLELNDLTRIGQLVPDINQFTGAIGADFKLGGTVSAPLLSGQARVDQVNFQVPLLGLSVKDANVTARTQGGDALDLTGGADIGGGMVQLTGSGLRDPAGWTFEFQLTGDQLKLADTKEYFALIDTELRGGIGPGGGSIQGVVSVAEARIMPRSIPAGTVSASPDVVVEGAQGAPAKKDGLPFHVDVELKLSDAVLIEAFGLRANLRGSLRAVQEPNLPLLGDGQLEIVDGTYRLSSQFGVLASVGAPLKIEQGILVFAKTPLTNPGLVLRAQREGGDMTAGVRVLGTLKKPKLAFFSDSDPNMTDSEIVSYLLTGVPPKGNASDIDQSLSVGTYIAPNLFLEYESNLGDQADRVKLRYDLNNWIELQTETGESQGADVFFKFEN